MFSWGGTWKGSFGSRSNLGVPRVRCDTNCITPKRGSSLQMRLSLDGNRKGFQRLWGCWFMILIWPSVYIHPYGIYDLRTRTIQESDGIPQKQPRSAKSQVRFKLHHSKKRIKLTDAAFFGWKLKRIQETLGVLIYDRHFAVCVYSLLWNLWSPTKNYPREWRYPPEAT